MNNPKWPHSAQNEVERLETQVVNLRRSLSTAEARIVELETHSENLDKSLTRTEEKLKAATETLGRVNGRAQVPDEYKQHDTFEFRALRDIRAMCERGLMR